MDSSSPQLDVVCIVLFASCSVFFLPFSESIYFEITRFSADATNIHYTGDAVPSFGVIQLNRLDWQMRVGHAIYADPVQIWDSKSQKLSDFSTHFTFIVDTEGGFVYGDAFSFFLAPYGFQIPPNSAGAFLGLFNTTDFDSDRYQILFVEFDSYVNTWDPQYGPHVGINVNSIRSRNDTAWNTSLHSGHSADAWVSYNATTQLLSLSWRYVAENTSQDNNNLSYNVDLRQVLPEWVTIGFSGTTGMVAYAIYRKIHRKSTRELLDTIPLTSLINDDLERGAGPKRFSFRDLALATNNFADDLKLGAGGFGCVYKGYLSREGIVVAVKKISQGSKQGMKEYITEVKIISSLRHRNLVQLIGWCHDQTQFLLVYEFLPNASLDYYLFSKKSPLEWDVRYKIAMGLASALLYLHEECEQCVVHRDIKASNIMLDSGYNSKLGDFGLARFMDHELGFRTTEIACGRKVTDGVDPNSDLGLVHWVWDLLGKDELLSGVDLMLNNVFDKKEVECLMRVGLWCAHPDSRFRPSISQAIQALKFERTLPNLPVKMPVPTYFVAPDALEVSSASASMTNNSIDGIRG
nr:L-type lectin-domain containing receptor kinase IX.1-like [Tanacetum cinerariifolium]